MIEGEQWAVISFEHATGWRRENAPPRCVQSSATDVDRFSGIIGTGDHWDSPLTYRKMRLSRAAGKRMTTSSATELVMIKATRKDASCAEFVMKL